MADSFYPQISGGTVAQYPIRKQRNYRTIKNTLSDGRLILLPDRSAKRVMWNLSYSNLDRNDIEALAAHYRLCHGPLSSFTFLDPTSNMFVLSEDLTTAPWLQQNQISIEVESESFQGKYRTFRLINRGQAPADLYQSFRVPTNFFFTFSMYVKSQEDAQITIFRRGSTAAIIQQHGSNSVWRRIHSQGRLQESALSLEAGLTLSPGQQIEVCCLQLEPQIGASDYRSTGTQAGVYRAARYSMNEFLFGVDAVDLYSTNIFIESAE